MKPTAFVHLDRFRAITIRELDSLEERFGKDHRDRVAAMYTVALYEAPPLLIDMCDHGHKFGKLDDHPTRDGKARCPYCMAIGLDKARAEIADKEQMARDIAVCCVDLVHGYTYEFSGHPAAHKDDYDRAEVEVKRILTNG